MWDEIVTGFESHPRPIPADIQELESTYLDKRVAALRAEGKTVDFNDRYALKSIRIERPQAEDGKRRNRPEFIFEPTNFKYYLMVNDCLDAPLLPEQGGKIAFFDPTAFGPRIGGLRVVRCGKSSNPSAIWDSDKCYH